MPSYDECLVEAELRARAAYAEPHRHYHSQPHLDSCLEALEGIGQIDEQDRRLLRWAILWHDAVYDPHRTDNEERSAKLAEDELRACGVDAAAASRVAALILLTKGHRVGADDLLGSLLVSIDLSILGTDPETYQNYAAQIRREYADVPDEAWRVGRAAILTHLLAAEAIYPDPGFQSALEEAARRNIRDELRSLSEG